jgi:hypothetical protein
MNISLCHFGDNCAPGILIDDIIKQNIKFPFMLGGYDFNNILNYLNDNNYEKIYSKEYLIIQKDNIVHHTFYKFSFNHEYEVKFNRFTNYDFIKQRFDLKIRNFRGMLQSNNFCIFIAFTENVDTLKISEMLEWLKKNKPQFHLIIYTNNSYTTGVQCKNLTIITLKNSYKDWWSLPKPQQIILYKEIYDEFINCLNIQNITNNLPKIFEHTYYFINLVSQLHPPRLQPRTIQFRQ